MVSWVCSYLQTCQVVYINYVQIFVAKNDNFKKWNKNGHVGSWARENLWTLPHTHTCMHRVRKYYRVIESSILSRPKGLGPCSAICWLYDPSSIAQHSKLLLWYQNLSISQHSFPACTLSYNQSKHLQALMDIVHPLFYAEYEHMPPEMLSISTASVSTLFHTLLLSLNMDLNLCH